MSTIANLKIGISGDNSQFLDTASKTLQAAERISVGMVKQNVAVRAIGGAWRAADVAVGGYLGTAAKVGASAGAIALAAKAIKDSLSDASTDKLSESFKSVREAVQGASSAFAQSFASYADLQGVATNVSNALHNLTPAFQALGAIAGAVVRPFLAMAPVFLGLVAILKSLAVVIGVVLHIAITRMIVQMITLRLLHVQMTPLTLAWAAAKLVLTAAIWAFNAAQAAALALGLPLWTALAAAALTFLAPFALIAGIGAAVYAAWSWLTKEDPAEKAAKQMEKLREATTEATKDLHKFINTINDDIETFGLSESEKKMRDFQKMLNEAKNSGAIVNAPEWEAAVKRQIDILDSMKAQKAEQERIAELEKQRAAAGAELVAHAQRALETYGMTANQIAIYDAQAKGVASADIAAAQAIMAKVEALDAEKKQREEIAQLAKEAMKMEQDRLKQQANDAKAVIDSVKSPVEKVQETLDKLSGLRNAGAISQDVYLKALQAEEAKFRQAEKQKPSGLADQGGAIAKGSQADIAARFKQPSQKVDEQILDVNKQQFACQQKIQAALEKAPADQVVELN